MAEFILDGIVAKAKLKPGTYRVFTDGNEDMPWGGPVEGTEFIVPEPGQVAGGGSPGKDGKSAYQIWLDAGHAGTEADFLASLKGEPGKDSTGGGTLPDIITPATVGGPSQVAKVTVDAQGRVTGLTPVTIVHPIEGGGGLADAPTDGKLYARKSAAWSEVPASTNAGGGSTTITVSGGSLPKPTTTADVQALLSAAASNNTIVAFDPQTRVEINQPLVMRCKGNDGSPWGILGNGAKLIWKGAAGGKMLTVQGATANWSAFQPNRGLIIEKLFLDGQGTSGDLLTVEALYGDPGSIYKSVLRDIYCVYSGANGITYRGAVFESYGDNLHAENCLGHGMETMHDTTDRGGGRGIISNINIMHPNFSRNKGAGLKCTYSTNLSFGSFVLNAQGGVVAPEGLRSATACNGENTGEALFVVQVKGYGSYIQGNEVSSDGQTVHRQFEGGQWVTYGTPCLYLLSNIVKDINIDTVNNHCSYYGPLSTNPMRVLK